MPNKPLEKILFVEPDEEIARLMQKRAEKHGYTADIAPSPEEALSKLKSQAYDLVLLDHESPGVSALELFDKIVESGNILPVVVLVASGCEKIALAALEKGVADYVVKDAGQIYLDLLPTVIQAAFTKSCLMIEYEKQKIELKQAKEKIEAVNQAKNDFLATMSHEIRTPLNVVTGLTQLLGKTKLNTEQNKLLSTLQSNADLLLQLINDLLDISRIEAGQMGFENAPVRIGSLLDDVGAIFAQKAQEKGLVCAYTDMTKGLIYEGDRMRIQQILMNLISNTIKFTGKGTLSITARPDIENEHGIKCLELAVEDTGIGISPEKQGVIFDKFTQTDDSMSRRFGGSGFGLSIVKSLVETMGGSISLASRPGAGSKFTVLLPLQQAGKPVNAETLPEQAPAGHLPAGGSNGTVLIVEDYVPNILVASMILEDLGYQPIAAENGNQAIEIVSARKEPFIAILMDVQMQGIDGLETTRCLRKWESMHGIRNYIIGVTAHALAGDRERCIASGMDDYMSKPIHPEILSSKLAELSRQSLQQSA